MKITTWLSHCMDIGEGEEMLRSSRNDQSHIIFRAVSPIAQYLDSALEHDITFCFYDC